MNRTSEWKSETVDLLFHVYSFHVILCIKFINDIKLRKEVLYVLNLRLDKTSIIKHTQNWTKIKDVLAIKLKV